MKTKQDVVKSNALIEAVYQPGCIYQMRLFITALLQVKAGDKLDHGTLITVTATQLSTLAGHKRVLSYRELKKAADQLMGTTVNLPCDHLGNTIEPPNTAKSTLVHYCQYLPNEGCVQIQFSPHIIPYISELKKRYTQYQAQYVLPMQSGYGIRLYELCKQYESFGERVFAIEQFKDILCLTGKSYERIDLLKSRVVTPALKDINTHSDLEVAFSQRKRGRVVSHFVFTIAKKKAAQGQATAAVEALSFEDWVNRYQLAKDRGFEDWKAARKVLGGRYRTYKKDPQKWVEKNCA